MLLRAADLHAGRYQPVPFERNADSTLDGWYNGSLVFTTGGMDVYLCRPGGSCRRLAGSLPGGPDPGSLVLHRGA